MTKFDYCSDLHLDIYHKKSDEEIYKLIDKMLYKEERADNLVIVGDIATSDSNDSRYYTILNRWCQEHYNNIFVVLGNHDYYGGELSECADKVQRLMQICIVLDTRVCPFYELNEEVVVVGSTMWTNLNDPFDAIVIQHYLNDYRSIRVKDFPLCCMDVVDEYENAMRAFSTLAKRYSDRKIVMCTHHVPITTIKTKHTNDTLRNAYYVDNSNFILENTNIVAWVCGHIHEVAKEEVGHCNVYVNCRGYMWEDGAKSFVLKEFEV